MVAVLKFANMPVKPEGDHLQFRQAETGHIGFQGKVAPPNIQMLMELKQPSAPDMSGTVNTTADNIRTTLFQPG